MTAKNILVYGAITGFIVGVIFIYIQPLFGMSPLTDRHAAAYTKLGDISPAVAIGIAWAAHLIVSTAYGLATALALILSKNTISFALLVFALGWITTVIAGPANQLIVRAVTSGGMPALNDLPALNFNFDAKLVLHLIFFIAIALFLWIRNYFAKADLSAS